MRTSAERRRAHLQHAIHQHGQKRGTASRAMHVLQLLALIIAPHGAHGGPAGGIALADELLQSLRIADFATTLRERGVRTRADLARRLSAQDMREMGMKLGPVAPSPNANSCAVLYAARQ